MTAKKKDEPNEAKEEKVAPTPAPAKAEVYVVKALFRTKGSDPKNYYPGDDVTALGKDRLKKLEKRGLVSKQA